MEDLLNKKFRRVLIIDDDDDDRALIAESLKEIDSNINCRMSIDGKAGLSYLYRHLDSLPDIIFLDLHMPRMTGLDFLIKLKEDSKLSQIPIVICSDSRVAQEMEECKNLGANLFIMKPASFVLLKFEIKEVLKEISNSRDKVPAQLFNHD